MFNRSRVFSLKRNGKVVKGANVYHGKIISVSVCHDYTCILNAATDKKLSSRRYKLSSIPFIFFRTLQTSYSLQQTYSILKLHQ